MKNAIMHYRIKLLIRYFNAWKLYHEYKIKKLNIDERISVYNRTKLLKKYLKRFILVGFIVDPYIIIYLCSH